MTQNAVEAIASNVWAVMMAQPALFALTMAACIAFEQSEEPSDVHVTFKEKTPSVESVYFTPADCTPPPTRGRGNNDLNDHDDVPPEPYSYTCDRLSAWQPCHSHPPRARAMRMMLTPPTPSHAEDKDSGIRCNVLYLHDDCLLLILSNLIHELAHGFRRLVFWRSHVDGVPLVIPWAPRNAVRCRNSCCGVDPPGIRGCPRSLGQLSSYEPADAPSPTPPASPPPAEVCALCTGIAKRLDFSQ